MADDPVADDADAAVLDWETGLPPIKHEDLPRIVQQKIAAELTRIRFELSALRKALKGGSHQRMIVHAQANTISRLMYRVVGHDYFWRSFHFTRGRVA